LQIQPPTVCPTCETPVEYRNALIYCPNSGCAAQWDKKVEHFASILKIKGLGPSTVKRLQIQDYPELYQLTVEETTLRLGSEKLAQKLVNEIEKSKQADLQTLLPAFSIPLFGRSAAQKLCDRISHIEEITENSCVEAGIGPKATANLIDWLEMEFYPNGYDKLPFSFKASHKLSLAQLGTVCISGKLKSFRTKAEAQRVLENYGYTVKTSLTKDCTHLLNESGIESAKTQTARDRGVLIINNAMDLIGEIN
jgi:DNA ligase (NAD+)